MIQWKKWEGFAVYTAVIAGTLLLRFVADYPEDLVRFFRSNILLLVNIAEYLGLGEAVLFLKSIPAKALLLIVGILHMAAGFCVLKIKKPLIEQGVMLLTQELPQVIKSGTILYGMIAALLLVCIFSVIGVPFGAFLMFLMQVAVIVGRIPLAVFVGYLLMERLSIRGYTYLYFFIGGFCMLLCESVYAIGVAFLFFVFPVLSIGALFTLFLYRCVYKISLLITFPTSQSKEIFDRKKIRDIITKT